MVKKVLAAIATVTVLALGGIAVAGAVSAPSKTHTAHPRGGAGNLVALAVQTAPTPPDKSALQKAISDRALTPATPN